MAALSSWEKSRIHQFLSLIGTYLQSVVAGTGISVDSTDAQNPVVSAKISTDVSNAIVLGTDDGLYAATGGGSSDGGLTVQAGPQPGTSGAILATQAIYFQAPADYTLTGWQAFCDPSATCAFDVWVSTFPTLPVVGDSITGGSSIGITAGASNTGNVTGWSSVALTRGNWIAVVITSNDIATFISFQLQGDKA